MRHIDYNFQGMLDAISGIKECSVDPKQKSKMGKYLRDLKEELNKFFKDSTCEEIIYTDNTDKIMFGMSVIPVLKDNMTYDYLSGTEKIRIDRYYIELDSKLFSPVLNLTNKEILAVLLHEVGHLVNDATPVENLRGNFAKFLTTNHMTINATKNVNYLKILQYGIKDALRKMNSLFERKDDEILADEFVTTYGYGHELESALTKIVKHSHTMNRDVDDKFIVLAWILRLYVNVRLRRIPALRTINKAKSLTPSFIERKELDNLVMRLKRIDDDSLLHEAGAIAAVTKTLKRKGIRGYEEDMFEYAMQIRNIQHEDDALILMHRINSRMAIIDDYLSTEELSSTDVKRWSSLYEKYGKLRETLANKTLYKDDYNRIYVTYPEITDNR